MKSLSRLRQREDTGASLVIAVIVMSVLSTLTMALLARTLSVMSVIRTGQDFDAALAIADGGLADALFRIDQGAPISFNGSDKDPLDPNDSTYYQYRAERVSDTEFLVTSLGYRGRSRHAVQAVINRGSRFPYALWSDQELTFNGSLLGTAMKIGLYAFNQLQGDPDTVRIGSNVTVTCHGTPDPEVLIDWYQTVSDCKSSNLNQLVVERDTSYTTPTTGLQACPPGGIFGLATATELSPAVINGAAGPFVCRENVSLLGYIRVENGPVQIYIEPTVDAAGNVIAHHSLEMSSAIVNLDKGASQFQLYKRGDAPINLGAGNTSSTMTFRGVLWAPDSDLIINGGLWWAGSINVDQLVVNGTPNLLFGYDWDLGRYLGKDWKISRYREIAAAPAAAIVGAALVPPPPPPPPAEEPPLTIVPPLPTTTTSLAVPDLTTSTTTTTTTTAPDEGSSPTTTSTTTSTLLPPLGP